MLLLHEFDLEIKDKKGFENVVADHLSKLEDYEQVRQEEDINDEFLDNLLLSVQHFTTPWFADIANYLACGILPQELSYQQRKHFLYEVKHYLWEDPFLYKICGDRLIRKCVPEIEMLKILSHCHDSAYGGHFGETKTATKVLESGFL